MEEKEPSYTVGENVMVQPIWRTVGRFIKKLKLEQLYDPVTLLLGVCLEKMKTLIQRATFTPIFISSALYNSYGEGNGTPLQCLCLENPMDGGAWWAAVHRVAKSRTRLRDFPFTFHFHALEKEMATHSSVLAWRIPGTEEPGGLPSLGSHRVRHD